MKYAALVLLMVSFPLSAQSTDATVWVSTQMNDDGGRFAADEVVEAQFDNGSGIGLSVSRTFGSRVSGELAVFRTSSSAEVREAGATLADLGDVELTPITAMVRYHFLPGRTVDVYVGAGLAHVMANDLDSADLRAAGLAPVRLDDKTTGAIGAGLTIALTPRLGIALDARYIPLEITGRAAGDAEEVSTDMNPLLLSAGLRFRF